MKLKVATIGDDLAEYVERRRTQSKPNTVTNIDRVVQNLVALFGRDTSVATTHYLQVLDLDFQKAFGGGAESGAVRSDQETPKLAEVPGG